MPTLYTYMAELQGLIRDRNQTLMNPADLISYINRARRLIAEQAQCIRVLPPISAGISTITMTAGGSGYSSSPTVTISAPDSPGGTSVNPLGVQATATATVIGGVITDIQVDYGGDGYFKPQVTITDTTGSGATATANVTGINVTQQGQEIYKFSDIDLSSFPGVGEIIFVESVSFLYANYRYMTMWYSFSTYQAMIRQYPRQYQYVPTIIAQLGQGASGSIYEYPIPSTTYQQEWVCYCWPQDLTADESVEILPAPWTDAVVLLASHYAFNELQNYNTARYYLELFDNFMHRHSAAARQRNSPNRYGRYAALFAFLATALSALVA